MKKNKRTLIIAAAAVLAGVGIYALAHNSKTETAPVDDAAPQSAGITPVNITIMLDLSDRLSAISKNDKVPQMQKDTAIIGKVQRWFVDRQYANKLMTGDHIEVICYPYPDLPALAKMQNQLNVDLTLGSNLKQSLVGNRAKLDAMEQEWPQIIDNIYTTALQAKNWPGGDIWDFFNVSARKQCVRKGSRNILIILTDGYIYHKNSYRQTAPNVYTGIIPRTVNTQTAITPVNQDMSGLEVLFLEINPRNIMDFGKMEKLLTDWCQGMGVEHVDVARTDRPSATAKVLEDFLEH